MNYSDFLENVGHNIDRMRNERGMMQKQLAIDSQLSVTALSNYTKGKRAMNIYVADSIAHALGVTIDDLIRGAENDRK